MAVIILFIHLSLFIDYQFISTEPEYYQVKKPEYNRKFF